MSKLFGERDIKMFEGAKISDNHATNLHRNNSSTAVSDLAEMAKSSLLQTVVGNGSVPSLSMVR